MNTRMNTPTTRTPPAPPPMAEATTGAGSEFESLAGDWRAGFDVPAGRGVRIVENTGEVYHLVLPPDPNAPLADEDLRGVSGGSNCLGSAGTVASAATFISTVSSSSTAATASST